ncbi:hypothetical protein PI124_g21031 [Phytophthora idaei]|nr:hypothetical protein PI126_g21309 [Phytophthora idaei]KAG3233906.1 hypothetical protein PI124_g21031 [Phytophthora idaei]
MFRNLSFDKEVVKAILRQWKEYVTSRKQWVDVLWIHHKRNFQGEGLVDEEAKPEEQKELPPELVFEPPAPFMSLENLPWSPTSVVWNASVMTLDAAEPWCNCWLEKPRLYSFNTTFLPCNPTARIFVPHGHTPQSVGPRIVIDGSVSTWEVVIGWYRDWRRAHTAPSISGTSQGATQSVSPSIPPAPTTSEASQASSLGMLVSATVTLTAEI